MMTLYRSGFTIPPLPPPNTLHAQHVLITGGNTGLGLALALHCLNLNAAQVTITSRSASKGSLAIKYLEDTTTGTGIVKVMHLDMSTFRGVKEFVEELERRERVIDVVFLNAGVLVFPGYAPMVSGDGWELTLQVNTLGTVLLGVLLLPWLKSAGGGRARMGFTGSGMHMDVNTSVTAGWPQEDVMKYWHDARNYEKAGGMGMYMVSKLLLEYGVREIAKLAIRADGRPEVIVTSCCPGITHTDVWRQAMSTPITGLIGRAFLTFFAKSPKVGAAALVHAALKQPEDHGTFYTFYQTHRDYKIAAEKNVLGPEGQRMQKQVWGEIVAVLAEKVPEIENVIR